MAIYQNLTAAKAIELAEKNPDWVFMSRDDDVYSLNELWREWNVDNTGFYMDRVSAPFTAYRLVAVDDAITYQSKVIASMQGEIDRLKAERDRYLEELSKRLEYRYHEVDIDSVDVDWRDGYMEALTHLARDISDIRTKIKRRSDDALSHKEETDESK